uniref:Down syndrome cell adhesion molecule-like protein Dscam2 n=1 Tax=Timema cristinae TaxID=61476 RepID=A0A7R9CDH1_TIMCR|nr:unnamed protein product [Timema cristinae]
MDGLPAILFINGHLKVEERKTPTKDVFHQHRLITKCMIYLKVKRMSSGRRGSVQMPCLAVGIPLPKRHWFNVEGIHLAGDPFTIQSDGTLHIIEVQRQHQGNYTCSISNANGSDQITYFLRVLAATGIMSYGVRNRELDSTPTETKNEMDIVINHARSFTWTSVMCGDVWLITMYLNLVSVLYNAEPSEDATLQLTPTDLFTVVLPDAPPSPIKGVPHDAPLGLAPSAPVVRVAATSSDWLQLQWSTTDNGGSAIRGYFLNFRKEEGGEWEERAIQRDATFFRLHKLDCGTQYQLQMMAYNAVGSGSPSSVVIAHTDGDIPIKPTYLDFIEVNTSNITLRLKSWGDNGCPIISYSIEYKESSQQDWLTGTLGPDQVRIDSQEEDQPFYLDLGVILPIILSLTLLAVVIAGLFICFHRRSGRERAGGGVQGVLDHQQAMVALDNKQNLAQREQYYAEVQKGIGTHSVERIPEYAEDISPYATFHVQSQQTTSSPAHIQTFVYHDHRLAAMETMQLKSTYYIPVLVEVSAHAQNQAHHLNYLLFPKEETYLEDIDTTSGKKRKDPSFPPCLDPPTGFSDSHELSEAECDMDTIHRLKGDFQVNRRQSKHDYDVYQNFTIAV